MEQTFTIPEGFELKQTGENQFSIVEKNNTKNNVNTKGDLQEIHEKQMYDAVKRHQNSFFKQVTENRNDYDFGYPMSKPYDRELMESRDRDELFDTRFANPYNMDGDLDYSILHRNNNRLHDMYNNGQIKKLNEEEMKLLRFCHGIDVKKFIKEEFERNPIVLKQDENGYFYAETPNNPKPDDNPPKSSIYDIIL